MVEGKGVNDVRLRKKEKKNRVHSIESVEIEFQGSYTPKAREKKRSEQINSNNILCMIHSHWGKCTASLTSGSSILGSNIT